MNQQQNQQEGVSFPPSKVQQPQKQFQAQQFGQLPQPTTQPAINTFGSIPFQPTQNQPPNQTPNQTPNLQPKPPQTAFNPQNKLQQQNPPLIPNQQAQSAIPQPNIPGNKPIQFQPPQPFVQNPQNQPNLQKPQPVPFPKTDINNNKPIFPQPQNNPFGGGMQANPQFPINKFPQQIPNMPASQQKYEPLIVKDESDKKKLVENFTKYISEGNFSWAIECLKQIINNDIRVKVKDGKNSN
ncbi:unnamed protein product [Paramecium octaurelia]|uniref:Uncharacterized protein n=1 Tax=Paramecium octaurelia TaxID=43137 RepID=A0A8S1STU1_PAROT|nr:unnamed protein product [Paramecium octaurelia]